MDMKGALETGIQVVLGEWGMSKTAASIAMYEIPSHLD